MRKYFLIILFMAIFINPSLASHTWDNTSFIYRQHINITNNDAQQLYDMFTINMTFNHQLVVNQSKSGIGGNDVRIYCGTVQKHRVNETAWNLTNTRIRFRMDEFNITANSYNDTQCSIYYGNNMPLDIAPQNYTNIYLEYSDFSSQSDLENFKGTATSTLSIVGNSLQAIIGAGEPESYINYTKFNFSYPKPFKADVRIAMSAKTTDALNGLIWINATSFSNVSVTDNNSILSCWDDSGTGNQLRSGRAVNGTNNFLQVEQKCARYGSNEWANITMINNITNMSFYNATYFLRTIDAQGWSYNSLIGFYVFSDGDTYLFDNFTVRVYAAIEPTISFLTEEANNLTITSPINITYNITLPNLNFTISAINSITECWYILNSGSRTNLTSCNNLSSIGIYGSNSLTIYANQSNGIVVSDSVNFTVTQLNITRCSGTGTPVFNFTYRIEENDLVFPAPSTNGTFFEATLNTYPPNQPTVVTNFTYNLNNATYYDLCANVNATFRTDATIRYFNTSYSTRFYYLERFENNGTTLNNYSLYLLESSLSSTIIYDIRESDGVTGAGDVLVYADRFYPTANKFETVSIARTDSVGKAFTFLKMNTAEHRFRLFRDAALLNTIEKGVLGGDASVGLTKVFSLAAGVLDNLFNYYNKVSFGCSMNNVTSVISCTYNDPSGQLNTMYLTVQRNGSLTWTQVCQQSSTNDSGTLSCNVSSQGNGTFYFFLQGKFGANDRPLTLEYGNLNIGQTIPYGTEGLMFAFVLILTFAMVGSYNPTVSIMMAMTALMISVFAGFIVVSAASVVGIVIIGIIVALKQRS